MSLFTQSGVQLSHIEKLSPQSIEATFGRALELLDEPGWHKGKMHKEADDQNVQTYKLPARTNEKLMWHMRSSDHSVQKDIPYEAFRDGLLLNHAENEHEYIPSQTYCELVKTFHEGLAEGRVVRSLPCCDVLLIGKCPQSGSCGTRHLQCPAIGTLQSSS